MILLHGAYGTIAFLDNLSFTNIHTHFTLDCFQTFFLFFMLGPLMHSFDDINSLPFLFSSAAQRSLKSYKPFRKNGPKICLSLAEDRLQKQYFDREPPGNLWRICDIDNLPQ